MGMRVVAKSVLTRDLPCVRDVTISLHIDGHVSYNVWIFVLDKNAQLQRQFTIFTPDAKVYGLFILTVT